MKIKILGLLLATSAFSTSCFAQHVRDQSASMHPSFNAGYGRATWIVGIDFPEGQLAASLPSLEKKALAGDGNAAAAIYAGFSNCRSLRAMPAYKQREEQQCAGIDAQEISEIGKWLSLAATLGNSEAQYAYATGGMDDLVGAQNAQKHRELYEAYKQTSQKYLMDLAKRCNIDAIGAIVLDPAMGGLVFGKDPVRTYRYLLIQDMLLSGAAAKDAALKGALEREIGSAPVIGDAQGEATSLVNEYCR
jgi:hypothetical protein